MEDLGKDLGKERGDFVDETVIFFSQHICIRRELQPLENEIDSEI